MKKFVCFMLVFGLVFQSTNIAWAEPVYRTEYVNYNPGPDPATPEGRALVDILAEQPEYNLMSDAVLGKDDQKFRFAFGLMMTRTRFERNAVKILFIGQDATHIAEAAKQPGTSGFGGRVQDIGNYFGVDQGVSTTNAFLSTIKGQYGSFDHFYIEMDENNRPQLKQASFVDNGLWSIANGTDSEIRLKREAFWEWMIKNNPESLKLMIMFGGAARDAWAEFLIARGATVGTRVDAEKMSTIRVPETELKHAGGNNEFPVPVDRNGRDIYEILVGRRLDYSNEQDQELAQRTLREAGQRAIDMMVFSGGGVNGSGILNPAQLGGYDLEDVVINGRKTNSIRGLVLSDGTVVRHDLAFTMSPHPSALSKMTPADASAALKKAFERLLPLKKKGWVIEPDTDGSGRSLRNQWHEGVDYRYGRADISPSYFEFGTPDDRRAEYAAASRLDSQVIVAGSRDRVSFDRSLIEFAKRAVPSQLPDARENWTGRPRLPESRYNFDRGPGAEVANLILSNLDRDVIFQKKPGTDGSTINDYYVKTHPEAGFFGFHRGSFENSRALILADPHGLDDWNTARALSGARGQYLNGLMHDIGFQSDYLVIKTAPVGMDGATAEEWEYVRKNTEAYREVSVKKALENGRIEMIFTDGDIAKAEMSRILRKLKVRNIRVININRDGMNPASGIVEAGREASPQSRVTGQMMDISRSHFPFWARIWEGTSGDRVIDAQGKNRGRVRALIVPNWVVRQRMNPLRQVTESIRKLVENLKNLGLRVPAEQSIRDFYQNKGNLNEVPPNKAESALRVQIPSCRALFSKVK